MATLAVAARGDSPASWRSGMEANNGPMPYDTARHGPRRLVGPGFHTQVHHLVQQVPCSRVTTYGDLAAALGNRSIARQVGFAMAAANDDVPWWRVVAAGGRLARAGTAAARRQAKLLRAEGVLVRRGRVLAFAVLRFEFELPGATRW